MVCRMWNIGASMMHRLSPPAAVCRFGALNFLKLRQIKVQNCKIATIMAPVPISPEEARRRKV